MDSGQQKKECNKYWKTWIGKENTREGRKKKFVLKSDFTWTVETQCIEIFQLAAADFPGLHSVYNASCTLLC